MLSWTCLVVAAAVSVALPTVYGVQCGIRRNGGITVSEVEQMIESPNYPSNYPRKSSCTIDVRLQSPEFTFLRLRTTAFNLEGNVGCSSDYVYVEIFSEIEGGETLSVGRWCDQTYANIIEIPTNAVIAFKSNASKSNTGFSFSVQAVTDQMYCNSGSLQKVTAKSTAMYLYSPAYPLLLDVSRDVTCQWKIQSQVPSDIVHLESKHFDVGASSTSCTEGGLTIRNGNVTEKKCGANNRFLIKGSGPVLTLKLINKYTVPASGFALKYYSSQPYESDCIYGGLRVMKAYRNAHLLRLVNRQITTKGCKWRIEADPTDSVVVLEMLQWEYNPTGCAWSVSVYDGPDENALRLGNWCQKSFTMFRSSGQSVFITFTSNVSQKAEFHIKYYSRKKYDFSEENLDALPAPSFIWVPKYGPGITAQWPPNWVITSRVKNDCVQVEVLEKSLLPTKMSFRNYITVFDGPNWNSPELGVCDANKLPRMSGTGKSLRVTVRLPGFWMVHKTNSCFGDVIRVTDLSSSHYIGFPNVSNVWYTNRNITCRWLVTTSESDLVIWLKTVMSRLDDRVNCTRDSLTAYDFYGPGYKEIFKWCGTETPVLVSSTSSMLIVYKAWLKGRIIGFRLMYEVRKHGICKNEALTAHKTWSYLFSPAYPEYYSNNRECRWLLRTLSYNQRVKLELIEIDLQGKEAGVCKDYVDIIDGNSVASPNLARLCGLGYVQNFYMSSDQYMTVRFKSDDRRVAKGFKMAFYYVQDEDSSCINQKLGVTDQSQFLSSPNYPDNYPNNLHCTWQFYTTVGHVIIIEVISSQMENTKTDAGFCSADYATVYDGSDQNGPKLGMWCGENRPTYTSNGRFLYLTFISDGVNNYRGFQLKFRTLQSDAYCREGDALELVADTKMKYFISPNFPKPYPSNSKCRWLIRAVNSSVVKLDVVESELESSPVCSFDVVRVYDGKDDSSVQVGYWCGTSTPNYQSTSQYMYVQFYSDTSTNKMGFRIRYYAVGQLVGSFSAVGPIITGGVIGGVVFIIVVIIIVICIVRRKRLTLPSSPQRDSVVVNVNRSNSTVYVMSPVYVTGSESLEHVNYGPPPPYPGQANPAFIYGSTNDLPPPYSESESMTENENNNGFQRSLERSNPRGNLGGRAEEDSPPPYTPALTSLDVRNLPGCHVDPTSTYQYGNPIYSENISQIRTRETTRPTESEGSYRPSIYTIRSVHSDEVEHGPSSGAGRTTRSENIRHDPTRDATRSTGPANSQPDQSRDASPPTSRIEMQGGVQRRRNSDNCSPTDRGSSVQQRERGGTNTQTDSEDRRRRQNHTRSRERDNRHRIETRDIHRPTDFENSEHDGTLRIQERTPGAGVTRRSRRRRVYLSPSQVAARMNCESQGWQSSLETEV